MIIVYITIFNDKQEVHICGGTWNMAECDPTDDMVDYVGIIKKLN